MPNSNQEFDTPYGRAVVRVLEFLEITWPVWSKQRCHRANKGVIEQTKVSGVELANQASFFWSHSWPWREHVAVFGDLGAGDFETRSR